MSAAGKNTVASVLEAAQRLAEARARTDEDVQNLQRATQGYRCAQTLWECAVHDDAPISHATGLRHAMREDAAKLRPALDRLRNSLDSELSMLAMMERAAHG